MQSLVVTAVLWSWQMSSPSSLRENPHPPEGKHCLPPWHPGVLHTGCWPPEHWGFNSLIKRPRSGEGDEGTKINLNSGKYKYSSRFYFPGGNCVSCLLSVLSLISRIGVQASGVQTGHKIYIYIFAHLLLNQLKAIWGRNCVWFLFPHCRQPCKFPEWMLEPRDSWKCTRV